MLLEVSPKVHVLSLGYSSVSNLSTQSLRESCLRALIITRDSFRSLLQHGSFYTSPKPVFSVSCCLLLFVVLFLSTQTDSIHLNSHPLETAPTVLRKASIPALFLHLTDHTLFPGFKLPRSETKRGKKETIRPSIHMCFLSI